MLVADILRYWSVSCDSRDHVVCEAMCEPVSDDELCVFAVRCSASCHDEPVTC